jgi:hypothetical protein
MEGHVRFQPLPFFLLNSDASMTEILLKMGLNNITLNPFWSLYCLAFTVLFLLPLLAASVM